MGLGPAFGGGFFVDDSSQVTINTPENQAALAWMMSYRDKYGGDNLAAFRTGDQSLPGKTFPLLTGRYLMVMDGQWRVPRSPAVQGRSGNGGKRSRSTASVPCRRRQKDEWMRAG